VEQSAGTGRDPRPGTRPVRNPPLTGADQ
jgi:hypothetical protein